MGEARARGGRFWAGPSYRLLCGGALLFGLFLLAPAGMHSQDQDNAPRSGSGNVRVSVVAILATDRDAPVDPRLDCVAKEVRRVHPDLKLKGFRLAKMTCKSVPVGKADCFELVIDQHAAVTVLKSADKDNRVQLKITPPTLGEITYTTCCGKFFPILTRYQTKNGEWLIVAVRVQPCNGKKK
jgi:hypothetical protein